MTTFTKIKKWYQVTKPHKGYLSGMIILSFLASVVQIIQAFPTAYVITSITNSDYNGACIWLTIGIALTALFYILWHFYYIVQAKQSEYTIKNLSAQINQKVENAKSSSLKEHSMQKLILLLSANISTLDLYSDKIAYMSSYIFRALLSTIIVFSYSWYIGLAMLGVLFVLYFWVLFLSTKSKKFTDASNFERDAMGEKLSDSVENRELTRQLVSESSKKEDYLKQVNKVWQAYNRRGLLTEVRSYWTYVALYGIVTILTIVLVNITKSAVIPLAVYLVLAPYLIDIIDQAKAGYELIYELQAADVCRLRLETVLNMKTNDLSSFANNTTDNLLGSLVLTNVSYAQEAGDDTGSLRPSNIELLPHKITLFKGSKNCGKRAIFYMLRRSIRPTTGTITMDGINIYDFEKKTYVHNFNYATSKPYFYNASIIENLSYVGAGKKQIISVCKKLGIHSLIENLEDGYDTNLAKNTETISQYLLFMIGLARAVLSKSEWIGIYEFPTSLTKLQQKNLQDSLVELKGEHSIIIFSAGDAFADICDDFYEVTSGSVRKLQRSVQDE